MRRGIGRLRAGGSGFSPGSLFAAGEQGGWYDPSDISAMWQDSAGTTPVTATTQPVGLLLDKRLGLALSAEVITVAADRDFSSDTGFWSKDAGVTISGGAANWAATAGTFQLFRNGLLTIGKYYEFTYTVSSYTLGGIRIGFGAANSGTLRSAAGTYTERIVADGNRLAFVSVGASTTLSIDNISVKEVTGNHLIQATAASRPTLTQDGSGFYYLSFDGVDDGMASAATVDLSATSKLGVFAGVTKSSDAAVGMVAELTVDAAANTGGFWVTAPRTAASTDFGWLCGGTLRIEVNVTPYVAPLSRVLTGQGDISTPSSSLRVNGVSAGSSAASQGTGNFANATLYIGRRAGTSLPFNGRIYQLIIRGATSTAAQIASAETFVGSKMGIAL